MAEKYSYALSKIEVGVIAGDGGPAETFSEVGSTVVGTAVMTTEDATLTDILIEESDSPILSVESTPGKITFNWSTANIAGDNLTRFLGGTYTPLALANRIATLGSITGGSLYTNGTYLNVPLTGGTGTGATADITVAGGAVTAVVLKLKGGGYGAGNTLSAAAANIGNTGSGFTVPVATIDAAAVAESYELPDILPSVEMTVRVTDRRGNVFLFPRVQLSSKLSLTFTKDKVGQVDISGSLLKPSKAGVKKLKLLYAAA